MRLLYYSLIGLLALIVLLIINHDIFFRKADGRDPAVFRAYRRFLYAILLFYVTDVLWGVLSELGWRVAMIAETEVYFVAMALGILFLARYVIAYLNDKSAFRPFLLLAGQLFFVVFTALAIINLKVPVLFAIDEQLNYKPGLARYVMLCVQIALLLATAVYAFSVAHRTKTLVGGRYLTIGLFCLVMLLSIGIQIFFPLLPLYSIGYMLGDCLLHTFVIEGEKEEARQTLETALRREQKQSQELKEVWGLAYTDALTGAGSKLAYLRREEQLNEAIANGTSGEWALLVFDVNDLKATNDTLGHDAGDQLIVSACRLINECFPGCPVYRLGGDEFVVFLEEKAYAVRETLLEHFDRRVEENRETGGVLVAAGMARFRPGKDQSFNRIFDRADRAMYAQKEKLKSEAPVEG